MTSTTTTTPATHAVGLPSFGKTFAGSPLERVAHMAGANRTLIIVGFAAVMVVATLYYMARDFSHRRSGAVSSGGLNYVIGPMGSGKSMFGVRTIVGALCAGKYVVTNVRLLPGWSEGGVCAREGSSGLTGARLTPRKALDVLRTALRPAERRDGS